MCKDHIPLKNGTNNGTNNANSTLAYQTRTIFHWLVLGLALDIIGSREELFTYVGHYWLALGIALGIALGLQAFQIPTCWYQQRESLRFGAVLNAKPQREWFPVAVEYRLNCFANCFNIYSGYPLSQGCHNMVLYIFCSNPCTKYIYSINKCLNVAVWKT